MLYWSCFHVTQFYEQLMFKNSVLTTTKSNQPAVYCKNYTVRQDSELRWWGDIVVTTLHRGLMVSVRLCCYCWLVDQQTRRVLTGCRCCLAVNITVSDYSLLTCSDKHQCRCASKTCSFHFRLGLVTTQNQLKLTFITGKYTDSRSIPWTLFEDRVSEEPYATERVLGIRGT